MIYKESRVTIKKIAMECVQSVNGGRSVFKGGFRRSKPFKPKEGAMIKRSVIVMALTCAMMGMFITDALAGLTFYGSGKFQTSSYFYIAGIKGGAKPIIIGQSFLLSEIQLLQVSLACKNGGKWDVRNLGGGGTTEIFQITDLATGSEGGLGDREQGKFYVSTYPICWSQTEIDNNKDCDPLIFEYSDISHQGPLVTDNNCRNTNWTPEQLLIQTAKITGSLQICDDTGCTDGPQVSYFCETKTPTNIVWLAGETDATTGKVCDPSSDPYCVCESSTDSDGVTHELCTNVTYLCWDFGSPLAWDDNYSVRAGGTLRVKAPGVLSNDHDVETALPGEDSTITKISVNSVGPGIYIKEGDVCVTDPSTYNVGTGLTFYTQPGCNGAVFYISPDGSFTVTGLTSSDLFTYTAKDEDNNISNLATVVITVK